MADSPLDKWGKEFAFSGIAHAVAAVALGAIAYLIGYYYGWESDKKAVVAGIILLLFIALTLLLISAKRLFFDALGRRYMRVRTGIVVSFPNLEACKAEMQKEFKRAKEIRLLLQIGRRELGDSEASFFYSLALEKDASASMKILRASDDSPFLSAERAKNKDADYPRWMKNIKRLEGEIDSIRNAKIKVEERLHHEPFLWRIFIFDDVAFISAYLYPKDVDTRCVVYKLQQDENSLYTVFKKYFDYLWVKYDPDDTREPKERWATWD